MKRGWAGFEKAFDEIVPRDRADYAAVKRDLLCEPIFMMKVHRNVADAVLGRKIGRRSVRRDGSAARTAEASVSSASFAAFPASLADRLVSGDQGKTRAEENDAGNPAFDLANAGIFGETSNRHGR